MFGVSSPIMAADTTLFKTNTTQMTTGNRSRLIFPKTFMICLIFRAEGAVAD
jgi:hypothetical protein